MSTLKIRAQSLRVGDKLRARELRGTVISVEINFAGQGFRSMHVVVRQTSGKLVCKDFALGHCVTIIERESELSNV